MAMNIYKELLQDHYHHPRNKEKLDKSDFSSNQENPSCGDSVQFQGIIKDNALLKVTFTGTVCVISQATASLLTEFVRNKVITEILAFDVTTILNLIGMQLGPVRVKCALLPLQALQTGLQDFSTKKAIINAESCQSDASVTEFIK